MDGLIPDFQVFTSSLEPVDTKSGHPLFPNLPEATDDMPILTAVASSTEQDLQGDTMAVTALMDMCEVPIGQSVFLNHNYTLPDSYFGKTVTSPVLLSESGVTDLHTAYGVFIDPDNKNHPAHKTYDQITKFGARHGVSGGFMITQYSYDGDTDDWFAPIIIERVRKLEDSIVGIPASQRSWVEHAIQGLFERCVREDNGEEAIRLAPAYKGLFSNDYKELVKSIKSEGLRKELERRPIRQGARTRLYWEPVKKHFVFQQGNRAQVVERSAIPDLIQKHLPPIVQKSASGKTSLPLMSLDTEWTGSKAEQEIFDYAKNEDGDIVASKAKQGFMWYDPDNADKQSGYKLPFCYVTDGSLKIVPLGVRAVANVLSGGRGGTDIGDDEEAVKGKVKTIYGRINSELKPDPEWVVPWEKEKSVDILTTKAAEGPSATTPAPKKIAASTLSDTEEAQKHTLDAEEMFKSLLLEQYNALGQKLGMSPVELGKQTTPTKETDSRVSHDELEALLKFAQSITLKASDENKLNHRKHVQAYAQVLHDIAKAMGGSEVCSVSAANGDENDGDVDDMPQKSFLTASQGMIKGFNDLVETLKSLDTPAIKSVVATLEGQVTSLSDKALVLEKSFSGLEEMHHKAAQQVNALATDVQTLKNMPLGNPLALERTVTPAQEGTVSYQELLEVNKQQEKGVTSLKEALGYTKKVRKELGNGQEFTFRHWPAGVGGTVKDGVRPELTGSQKARMDFRDWYRYADGSEAYVPVIPGEDPEEVLARQR